MSLNRLPSFPSTLVNNTELVSVKSFLIASENNLSRPNINKDMDGINGDLTTIDCQVKPVEVSPNAHRSPWFHRYSKSNLNRRKRRILIIHKEN
jgi:hypothetical protein